MLSILVEWSYWTLNISLIGCLVACLILLYRKLCRYTPAINSLLWSVLGIRLLIPASYVTSFSIVNFYKLLGINITSSQGLHPFYFSNVISQAIEYHPVTFKSSMILMIFEIFSIIWIMGVFTIICFYIASYFFSLKLIKQSDYLGKFNDIDIYESSQTESPFLFGLFKPVVVLPMNLNSLYFESVILHEKAHRHNYDNLKRLFGLFVCSIHWFNPIVWICFKNFLEDLEIEADRKVTSSIGKENQKKYLETIVQLYQNESNIVGSGFSTNPLLRRIKTQLDYKPNITYTIWLFCIILMLSYFVLLANL